MANVYEEPNTLAEYQVAVHPAWLCKPWGRAWNLALGEVKDNMRAGFVYATLARFVTLTTDDGLAAIGWERDLEQGPDETNASYRERLRLAWERYEWTGTDKAVVDALKDLGLTAAVIRDNHGLAWIRDDAEALGGRFVQLGATAFTMDEGVVGATWARMIVVIYLPPWTVIETYTAVAAAYPTYEAWAASGYGFGINVSLKRIDLIRRLVKKWSASHVLIKEIAVVARGRLFGYPLAASFADLPLDTYASYVAKWEGW